jgi:hypothetical protein
LKPPKAKHLCDTHYQRQYKYGTTELPVRRIVGQKGRQIRYDYGVEIEEYQAMLDAQAGKCAICKKGETSLHQNGSIKSLAVDHCHETGAIRGLLCFRCNMMIGYAQDDPERLLKGAAYLQAGGKNVV